MAQARVTDFFTARKRNTAVQPSKRRKLQNVTESPSEITSASEGKTEILPTVRVSTRQRRQVKEPELKGPVATSTRATRGKTKTKQAVAATRQSARSKTTREADNVKTEEPSGVTLSTEIARSRTPSPVRDEPTAACDDHTASPPGTPTKRLRGPGGTAPSSTAPPDTAPTTTGRKRGRPANPGRVELLAPGPGQASPGYDFSKFPKDTAQVVEGTTTLRKKLVMKRRSNESRAEAAKESTVEKPEELTKKTPSVADSKSEVKAPDNKDLGKTKVKPGTSAETKDDKVCIKNVKQTGRVLDAAEVKAKLAKCGKLAELQERLAAFSSAASKVKREKQVDHLGDISKQRKDKANEATKAPAYERYHSLAVPVPPTLTLPYRYKMLGEIFHSVDTVVSMLYKRLEMCTFSKLKNGVQLMTKRAFEESHLGQIQRVYPDAYVLRQEKNLPIPGIGTRSGYQLTVEANLASDGIPTEGLKDKDGRPAFTATKLLGRKSMFHRLLVNIVKEHHKAFLSLLDRPLTVPDDKVTRWHPRFPVDKVPDVEPSPVPQPPDTKKFSTAAEVLQQARGGPKIINPRVQKALEMVMNQKESEKKKEDLISAKATPSKAEGSIGSTTTTAGPQTAAIKGVSQSLLDRIRAKEAQKQVTEMTRSPEEEKRRIMIGRLPEMVRIIRTFFVTYKKPCLAMEEAIQKVRDSCRSSLGADDVEAHIKLLIELVPAWISAIKVRKGTYLKVNRNQELASVVDTINKALKDKQ